MLSSTPYFDTALDATLPLHKVRAKKLINNTTQESNTAVVKYDEPEDDT